MILLALGQAFRTVVHHRLVLKRTLGDLSWLFEETLLEDVLPFVAMKCVVKVVRAKLCGHVIQWFSLS